MLQHVSKFKIEVYFLLWPTKCQHKPAQATDDLFRSALLIKNVRIGKIGPRWSAHSKNGNAHSSTQGKICAVSVFALQMTVRVLKLPKSVGGILKRLTRLFLAIFKFFWRKFFFVIFQKICENFKINTGCKLRTNQTTQENWRNTLIVRWSWPDLIFKLEDLSILVCLTVDTSRLIIFVNKIFFS